MNRVPKTREPELRRQLDRAFGRAVVDHAFATVLLADPTLALGTASLAPQHYARLQRLHAWSLRELACQAEALFWPLSDGRTHHDAPTYAGRDTELGYWETTGEVFTLPETPRF